MFYFRIIIVLIIIKHEFANQDLFNSSEIQPFPLLSQSGKFPSDFDKLNDEIPWRTKPICDGLINRSAGETNVHNQTLMGI